VKAASPAASSNRSVAPRSAWLIVIAYSFVLSSTMALQLTFAPVTTVAAEHFNVSVKAIGWLAQIFPLLYVVLGFPMGFALDRAFRTSLALGAMLCIAGATLRLVGDQYEWILAGQVLIAVALPLLLNGLTKVAGKYLSEKDRPIGISICMANMYAGELIAIGVGTVHAHPEQIHTAVSIISYYAIAALAFLLICLRSKPRFGGDDAASAPLASLRSVLADPFIRVVALLVFIGFGIFTSYMTWLQALLAPAGVAADMAGLMLLGFVVCGVAGAMAFPGPLSRRNSEFSLLWASVVIGSIVCALLAFAPGVKLGLIGVPILGLLQLSTLPVVMGMTERRAGSSAGIASAVVWVAGNAGGTAISMAVQGMIGHPQVAFLFMGAVIATAGPLLLRLRLAGVKKSPLMVAAG